MRGSRLVLQDHRVPLIRPYGHLLPQGEKGLSGSIG